MNLNAIREARAGKVAEARTLLAKADTEKRALSAEESTRFDSIKAEITDLESKEQRAVFLAECERRMQGEPVAGNGDASFAQLERRVSLLAALQASVEGRALSGAEAEYNAEMRRRNGRAPQGFFLPLAALETRVNTTTSAANLVPEDHRADQYIGPLRNALLARRLGVRVLSGLRGDVHIPKHGTSVTSAWVAENSGLSPSDMTFGNVSLTPKHVGSLSEMSRQLIQQSDPSIEMLLREDMAFALAKAIDGALIVGGGSNQPSGVIDTLGSANATLDTPTWDEVLRIIEAVETDNALSPSHAWLTTPQGKAKLAATLKVSGDAGAGYLYQGGQVADYPLYATNQMPHTSNGHSIIFGDWSQVILGVWSELDILVNPYESTAYAKGNVQVRAMATCDIAIRHEEAFAYADDLLEL